MKLDYIAYLPEHQDELELLGEAYTEYFFSSCGDNERMTEKEFILNRASPKLVKAIKELEVKLKKRQIDEDFKA